jgi:hypothetical protein
VTVTRSLGSRCGTMSWHGKSNDSQPCSNLTQHSETEYKLASSPPIGGQLLTFLNIAQPTYEATGHIRAGAAGVFASGGSRCHLAPDALAVHKVVGALLAAATARWLGVGFSRDCHSVLLRLSAKRTFRPVALSAVAQDKPCGVRRSFAGIVRRTEPDIIMLARSPSCANGSAIRAYSIG